MKHIFFLITCLSIFFACSEDQPYCGVEDPAEDLLWLKEKIEVYDTIRSTKIYVYKLSKNKQEGIYVCSSPSPGILFIDPFESYYDCQGEVVNLNEELESDVPGYYYPESKDSITYKELLWHN